MGVWGAPGCQGALGVSVAEEVQVPSFCGSLQTVWEESTKGLLEQVSPLDCGVPDALLAAGTVLGPR